MYRSSVPTEANHRITPASARDLLRGAEITFGGPYGETVKIEAGDVVVIPAGVGHRRESSGGGFSVVGAYPRGQENYDLRTGEEGERPGVLENIRNVPMPRTDPIFGEGGPLVERWSG